MRVKKYLSHSFAFLSFYQSVLYEVASEESITLSYEKTELRLDLFNTSVVHRQNFCEEQERFQRGEQELNLAIQGRHLNVALGPDDIFVKKNPDGSLNNEYPGLMPVLMDEVARRGKFTWRDSFTTHSLPTSTSDKTYTDLVLWLVETYDVAVWWWFDLQEREALGVSFPKGWQDGSLIIVEKQESESYFETFSPFSWSKPFTPGVWGLLLSTLIITGIIIMQLDPQQRKKNKLSWSSIMSSLYSSLMVFTGHLDLDPSTHAAQLISFSLSFFAMLMLSAYTANLASFLVIEKAAASFQVNTVGDIVRYQKQICIYRQAAEQNAISDAYADAIFVEKPNYIEVFAGLKNDECDYAVLGVSTWEEYEMSAEVNGECNLVRVGRKFKDFESGFATKSDAGTYCTSLVRDVIHSHMKQMADEGFVRDAWAEHRARNEGIIQCVEGAQSETKEDTNVLDIINLGGIFIFHYAFVIIASLVAIASKYVKRRGTDKRGKTEKRSVKETQNSSIVAEDMTEMITAVNERLSGVEDHLSRFEKHFSQIESFMQHVQMRELRSESKRELKFFPQMDI